MRRYLTTFLLVSVVAGSIIHFVTQEPMPWWPDTAIMGAVFGTLAVLNLIHHGRGRQRPSAPIFSAALVGLFLLVAGLVGYDADRHGAFRRGTPWTGSPAGAVQSLDRTRR